MEKYNKKIEKLYVIFIFLFLIMWAMATRATSGPDEAKKYDVCNYIATKDSLPDGRDPAIRNPVWGTSYGFTPLVSYIVSAVFLKIAYLFTEDVQLLYVAVRLTSVLCITGMAAVVIKIGHLLFEKTAVRWLFILLTTLLPQVLYLGSYLNNDAFALFTISIIIYAWVKGIRSQWDRTSCITLAVGIGLCALSYYNAYGYILCSIPLFFLSWRSVMEKNQENTLRMWKMAGVIVGISVLIAGWWFIRNGVIYQGDFLGLSTSNQCAENYAQPEYKPSLRPNPEHLGWSFYEMLISNEWIKISLMTFVGIMGTDGIPVMGKIYKMLWILIAGGYMGMLWKLLKREKWKESKVLYIVFAFSIGIPIMLSFYHSYWIDFQPQGRYIMPMLIPFIYFSVEGIACILEKIPKKWENGCYGILDIGIIASAFLCLHQIRMFGFS